METFNAAQVRWMILHPHMRLGQHLFNALGEVSPVLAKEISGTECDPYYATDADDPRVVAFFNRISPQ